MANPVLHFQVLNQKLTLFLLNISKFKMTINIPKIRKIFPKTLFFSFYNEIYFDENLMILESLFMEL